jgi:hypothetical protein
VTPQVEKKERREGEEEQGRGRGRGRGNNAYITNICFAYSNLHEFGELSANPLVYQKRSFHDYILRLAPLNEDILNSCGKQLRTKQSFNAA